MFRNAGAKIKVLALIMFWITLIGGTILGFALMEDSEGLSLLLIPGAFLVGWLANLTLYAFGELCENVYEINNKLGRNISGVSSYNYNVPSGQTAPGGAHPETASSYISNDTTKCPNCGKPTPSGEKYCIHCGDMIK